MQFSSESIVSTNDRTIASTIDGMNIPRLWVYPCAYDINQLLEQVSKHVLYFSWT